MRTGWKWTLLITGGHFWVDFYSNMLPPILPVISALWGLSNSQLAMVIAIQSMTSNFLQPVLGYLMDKYPQKWSLGLAIGIIALPMCFIYLADSYLLFIVVVTLSGFGAALYHPLGASRSVEGAGPEKALKMSVFSSLGSLGYAISPVITAYIIYSWGLKGLTYTVVPGLAWIVLLNLTGKKRELPDNVPVKASEDKLCLGVYKPLFLLCCIVACRSWLVTSCNVFFPLWMIERGMDERLSGLYLSLFLLAGTLGGLVFGYIYPKFGQKKLLIGSFIASICLLPLMFIAGQNLLAAFLILYGFILVGSFPITVVIGQELLPTRAGLASGMTMGLAFALGGAGTTLTGVLADHWGIAAALVLTSLLLIPASLLTYLLKSPQIKISQIQCSGEEGVSK